MRALVPRSSSPIMASDTSLAYVSGIHLWQLVHGWRVYDYIAYQKYRFSVRQHRWMMRNETLDESIAEPMQTLDLLCFSSQVSTKGLGNVCFPRWGERSPNVSYDRDQ